VHEGRLLDNPHGWHGAELSVTIAGNWQYYRAKILKYLQQIAVITPYAQARAVCLRPCSTLSSHACG
jgi:DNA topoisomerase VI subunit B